MKRNGKKKRKDAGADKARAFMRAQEEVARALVASGPDGSGSAPRAEGAQPPVRIAWDAASPFVDLSTGVIHIEPLPPNPSDEELALRRGSTDHEAAHILYTKLDPANTIEGAKRMILNAIEDGRINRLIANRFDGCRDNLARSWDILQRRAAETPPGAAPPGFTVFRDATFALLRMAEGDSRDRALAAVGPVPEAISLLDLVQDVTARFHELRDTADVLRATEEIHERWARARPDLMDAAPPAPGSACGGGRTGDLTAPPPFGGRTPCPRPGPERPHVDAEGKDAERARRKAEEREDLKRILKEMDLEGFADIDEPEEGGGIAIDAPPPHDVSPDDPLAPPIPYLPWPEKDEVLRIGREPNPSTDAFHGEGRARTGALARRLWLDLIGRGPVWARNRRTGKTLDPARLHRALLDDPRIFRDRIVAERVDSAISLLVDFSGSMSSQGRIRLAVQLAMAFSEACDLLDVPNEVLGFTSADHGASRSASSAPQGARLLPLRHIEVKPFDANFHRSRHAFMNAIDRVRLQENYDGEAVLWAAGRLAARRERGRTLIVLSDGAPQGPILAANAERLLASHLKAVVQNVEAAGIQCVGVGIKTRSVERFYTDHVVFNDLDDLVSGGYAFLSRLLRRARGRA